MIEQSCRNAVLESRQDGKIKTPRDSGPSKVSAGISLNIGSVTGGINIMIEVEASLVERQSKSSAAVVAESGQ